MGKEPTKILLVGFGKMGSAIYEGLRKRRTLEISVLDPSLNKTLSGSEKAFDIIILAVKPQLMDYVCKDLLTKKIAASLVISIAAGKTLKSFENIFGDRSAIIRTMPNTPALVGKGMTVGIANRNVTPVQKEIAAGLLGSLGAFEWLENEKLMDAVTALSGSGPAYVFLLIEEMAKAGIAQGLPPDLALKLARETVIGSAALAEAQPTISAETLRVNVTSPGGTTEAALKVLTDEKKGLSPLMKAAIDAATKRGRELS